MRSVSNHSPFVELVRSVIGSRVPWLASGIVLLGLLVVAAGCQRGDQDERGMSASTPVSTSLPPLQLREDTPHLLLTWVDKQGDFHVVQRIAAVPAEGRQQVRVVVTDREAGTGQVVYVANLDHASPDGTYPVKTMPRSAWEELGAARRKQRIEALAPRARPSASAAVAARPAEVVVYGAEWCGACHQAERYLKGRGVDVKLKDIESDALARAELQAKLKQANLPPTSSIPIIDVGGRLLVGFNPAALDRALRGAREAHTL